MLKEEKIETRRISHQDFLQIAGEILDSGKLITFRASGTSMTPFIKNGDAVTVSRDQNPGIGDVVLLKTDEGRLYLHRVVKKAAAGIVTRGDASFDEDGFTPCRNILGKVVRVSGGGYNFHLKRLIKKLISKRIIFSEGLYRHPSIVRLGKKMAKRMG
jgi:signal peptidase I